MEGGYTVAVSNDLIDNTSTALTVSASLARDARTSSLTAPCGGYSTPLLTRFASLTKDAEKLRKSDWYVADAELADGQQLVAEHHYSRGGSNTRTHMHGLYRLSDGALCGVAWWLPPTRVAAESVNKDNWRRVVSLSRLVVSPGIPGNAASFLLARSIRLIQQEGKWASLVTYADESQGHTGTIYRATGWQYAGRTGPYPRWVDVDGRQVATLATKTRTRAQMEALGYTCVGKFYKHKFVMHLHRRREPLLRGVCY